MSKKSTFGALREVLETAIGFAGADFGNIQVVDAAGHLRIFVHQGFPDWWIDYWNSVCLGHGVCGTSMALGERVIVEDVEQSPIFAGTPALEMQRKAGVRAVQSTPVISQAGQVIAMLSTHYRMPHRPDARTLGLLDLLAAHVATLIERAQAEVPLSLAENRYRTVVEDQTEVISRFLPDGTFTFANDVYCRTFGKTAEELIGTRWHPVAHPDDLPMIERKLGEMSPENRVVVIENRVFVANGELRWMQFANRGFFAADGHLVESQSVGRDITELKHAEAALMENQERLEMALAGSGLALWDCDLTSGRILFGQRWYEMLGYPVHAGPSHVDQWKRLCNPADLAQVEARVAAYLAGETPVLHSEHRMRHKEGYWVTVEARGRSSHRDAAGNPTRIVGTVLDISNKKRLKEEGIDLLKRIESLIRENTSSTPAPAANGDALGSLTKRERQILGMIAQGMTSARIGRQLKLSPNTVISHRQNLMGKLDLHSTAEVIRFALDHDLAKPVNTA